MKLKLTKDSNGQWRADCLDLPGMPPCGLGATEAYAVADLFNELLRDRREGWLRMIETAAVQIEVEGK